MLYFFLLIAFLILVVFLLFYFKDVLPLLYHGAVWQPSEIVAARRMLELAEVQPGECIIDLGSGDGRVLIAAAKEFGARATGVEINPLLVWFSRLRIWTEGLTDKIRVEKADMFAADVGSADVVILFQREETNERLKAKLSKEMRKGARLVSYYWEMKDWKPQEFDPASKIYLYRI